MKLCWVFLVEGVSYFNIHGFKYQFKGRRDYIFWVLVLLLVFVCLFMSMHEIMSRGSEYWSLG